MDILGIPVKIEEDDGGFVVSDRVVNMYGWGTTKAEAIADYKAVIREYHSSLLEGRLGDHLKKHLSYLNRKLK